jgi:hypothetical protein
MNVFLCTLLMTVFRLLLAWRFVTQHFVLFMLYLTSSGFNSPATVELVAEFKLCGNGNYSANSATLCLLVPAKPMYALAHLQGAQMLKVHR